MEGVKLDGKRSIDRRPGGDVLQSYTGLWPAARPCELPRSIRKLTSCKGNIMANFKMLGNSSWTEAAGADQGIFPVAD